MPETYVDLSPVVRAVEHLDNNIRVVSDQVGSVRQRVDTLDKKLEQFAQNFVEFVRQDRKDKDLQRAMTDLIRIRQELEKKFGNNDEVRRRTTGILQAVDVSVVRKETITSCTEDLMVSAPGYWLAPCLIAMAAWINDDRELADKAIREALRRDDEKSSLLFALIGRRASRYGASEVWLERYFGMQDPTALEREMVVVIDAFASGLFGSDSHGNCSRQIKGWVADLSEKAGFLEEQQRQWTDALLSKKHSGTVSGYQYLSKYSPTISELNDAVLSARMHQTILDYFQGVFAGAIAPSLTLAAEVDQLLEKLTSDFDEEELPLRREERLANLVIEEKGDRDTAQQRYDLEKVALKERFSFTQLLTNAAMHPETSHASRATQRLAVAISKEWILKAYEDITAQNRSRIPLDVRLKIEGWEGSTRDGANESELINSVTSHVNRLRDMALEEIKLGAMAIFALIAGLVLGGMGIVQHFNMFFLLLGVGGVLWFAVTYSNLGNKRDEVRSRFEETMQQYQGILKATLAETVDIRREIATEDAKYQQVMHFLEGVTPQQFISTNYSSRMVAG